MIKQFIYTLILLLGLHDVQAQYNYFNDVLGEFEDLASEQFTNVEVVDDGYVTWGGGVDDGVNSKYIRKFDFNGVLIDENILTFDNEYVLTGIINSFKWNPFTERFVYIHGSNLFDGTDGSTAGALIEFDTNLDTTFTRRYELYPPYTYPFIFEVENDGYIVVGEQGGLPNSNGTYIMKLDFDGNVLWNEVMQTEISQRFYRNWSILPIDGGYMVTGYGRINSQTFALITLLDENGITQSEIDVLDNEALTTGGFGGVQLQNGEYLLAQPLGYADVEEFENPNFFWNKTRLVKFDPSAEMFYDPLDYFDNYEMILGGPIDIEPTPDGGAIVLGGRFGWIFDYYSWMLKVDEDGNQEWFKEYTYESCESCWNQLYDIEVAPDGGYIAVGYFNNSSVEARNNPWLLKVDACGDTEWIDCSPVGVEEKEKQIFKIYPNPSAGLINIATDTQSRLAAYTVYDLSGRVVARGRVFPSQQISIELNLPVGLYALELVQKNGNRESHKVQILK